jgi:uncharacterized sulfatase
MQTPHLDQLAAGGVRFDAAYTASPVCTPARAAIFTGTYPHTNGAWGLELPLGQTIKTVGQRLRDAGVPTAYMGRWHLSATDYFDTGECPDGWDPAWWYDGRNYLEELPTDVRTFSRKPHTPAELQAAGFGAEQMYGHRMSDRAIRFLDEHAGQDSVAGAAGETALRTITLSEIDGADWRQTCSASVSVVSMSGTSRPWLLLAII